MYILLRFILQQINSCLHISVIHLKHVQRLFANKLKTANIGSIYILNHSDTKLLALLRAQTSEELSP